MNGDAGESHERTALAWQRTALALVAGSAVLTRLTFERLGLLALISVGVVAPLGLWLMLESRGRHRRTAGPAATTRTGSAAAPLVLTLATSAVAIVEIAALLVR